MEAIERLLAQREIEDLITRYCHAFDDQDWEALGVLWTEDATFVAAGVAFEGRKTLLDFLIGIGPLLGSLVHDRMPSLLAFLPTTSPDCHPGLATAV